MKNLLYILLFSVCISESLNQTVFTKLNNQIPGAINLNDFNLSINSKNNQKHYQMNQMHEGIPVFGRSIKIHYNIYSQPSSMSSSFHDGEFESSTPTLTLDDARVITVNDFSINEFWYN